jgi:hypothetical protein
MSEKTPQSGVQKTPDDFLSTASPQDLWQHLIAVGTAHHRAGDFAERQAKAAPHRRGERKWQSANKANRAVGTAVEATIWLATVVRQGMHKNGATPAQIDKFGQPMLVTASGLVSDLAFEANILNLYKPVPPASRPGPKKKG